MNDYEFDLFRIFFGDKPPLFLLEVAFRTLVIFTYTLVLLRWMGKRGMGQLTPFEFAIIVGLGSAVGDPMFYDDVPLIHTMLVIAIIIGLQHFLSWITEKNETIESWVEGKAVCLIKDGTINIPTLENERLSQSELFDSLRTQGIVHLGQVRAAFLERSGKVSVIEADPTRPGLCILPNDTHPHKNDSVCEVDTPLCCSNCGKLVDSISDRSVCICCGNDKQVPAWGVHIPCVSATQFQA